MYETHFEALSARYEELLLSSHQNEVILNQPLYQKTLRELSRLEPAIRDWEAYRKVLEDIEGAQELRQDPDLKDEAARELTVLSGQKEALEEKLRLQGIVNLLAGTAYCGSRSRRRITQRGWHTVLGAVCDSPSYQRDDTGRVYGNGIF